MAPKPKMEVAVIQIRSFKTVICKPMGDIIIVITWYITMCHSVFFYTTTVGSQIFLNPIGSFKLLVRITGNYLIKKKKYTMSAFLPYLHVFS